MTTAGRPAALLTLSRQQELSRYTKFNKLVNIFSHRLFELIEELSGLPKAITHTIRVKVRAGLKVSWSINLSCYNGFVPRAGFCGFRRFFKRSNCSGNIIVTEGLKKL